MSGTDAHPYQHFICVKRHSSVLYHSVTLCQLTSTWNFSSLKEHLEWSRWSALFIRINYHRDILTLCAQLQANHDFGLVSDVFQIFSQHDLEELLSPLETLHW